MEHWVQRPNNYAVNYNVFRIMSGMGAYVQPRDPEATNYDTNLSKYQYVFKTENISKTDLGCFEYKFG